MCRAIRDGGRRCLHYLRKRIAELEQSINEKDMELAELNRRKTKNREVRQRITELNAQLARRFAKLNVLEVKAEVGNHDPLAVADAEYQALLAEKEELEALGTGDRAINRRIKELELQLTKKRAQLEALREELAAEEKARDEAAARDAALREERKKAALQAQANGDDETLPTALNFLLTPEENAEVRAKAGDTDLSSYLVTAALTNPPTFDDTSAEVGWDKPHTRHASLNARDERTRLASRNPNHEIAGRKPATHTALRADAIRVKRVNEEREAAFFFLNEVAKSYHLPLSRYARKRALGQNLYANDGDMGAGTVELRNVRFRQAQRREFGDTQPTVAQLREFRAKYDRDAHERAYKKTVELYGPTAEAVLHQTLTSHRDADVPAAA